MKFSYCVVLFALLLSLQDVLVYANNEKQGILKREPFEKMHYQYEYKSIDVELKECEKLFNKHINLPVKLPSIAFTHQFARCNNLEGHINDNFEIEYLNQNEGSNHYMMRINPVEHKLNGFPHNNEINHTYKLKDGSKAVYGTTPMTKSFNVLVFEKESWQYILSVDKRIGDIVTAEVLVQITDSILQYKSEDQKKDSK